MDIVRHLRSADHIIAMGPKGNVVEQGTFAALEATDGYIKSLAIAAVKEADDSEHDIEENKASHSPALPSPAQSTLEGDDARRLGDFSVYNYYRKALTWWRLLSFIGLEALTIPAWRSIRECAPVRNVEANILQSCWSSGGVLPMGTILTYTSLSLSHYRY